MRRAWGLGIGLCTLVVLTGVAGAAERPVAGPRGGDLAKPAGQAGAVVVPAAAGGAAAAAPQTIGTVEQVTDGVLEYLDPKRSMTFRYPDASYVKVHFSRLLMLPGDQVTVSDPQGREVYTYTSEQLLAGGKWATSVTGDTAIVTWRGERVDPLGLRSKLSQLGVSVDRVARGFSTAERKARAKGADLAPRPGTRPVTGPGTTGREESICGRSDEKADAVCYKSSDPVAYNQSKAVARLLINGVELCTGWRVGPNNRMFTNHHCFADSYAARDTEVWFNYECAECGGWEVLRSTKVRGQRVLASDRNLDYTLFTVDDFESVRRFGHLELDPDGAVAGEELYIPQHPAGDPTMIAAEDPGEHTGNCAVSDPTYDGYGNDTDVSYYCDTEGGSSGSPVISRLTNQVIALHHFGGCPNSGVRIDLIQAQVRELL